MPKGSRHVVIKSAPYGKGKRSRKKHSAARHPAPLASRQVSPKKDISAASARLASPIHGIVPQQPYVLGELKRSGIIAGAMFLLLIILSLLL